MIDPAERESIFESVQAGTESFRGEDSPASALCFYRTVLTVRALHARGERGILQAGTAEWAIRTPDQDDGISPTHFGYVWSPDEFDWTLLYDQGVLPEVHVWAAMPASREIIDMSSGCFPEQAKLLMGWDWHAELPPKFLWTSELPSNAVYEAHPDATAFALALALAKFGIQIKDELGMGRLGLDVIGGLISLFEKAQRGTLTAQDIRDVAAQMATRQTRNPRRPTDKGDERH
jgi:hypothetical protein